MLKRRVTTLTFRSSEPGCRLLNLFYTQKIMSIFRAFSTSPGRLKVKLGSYATEVWARTSMLAARQPKARCNSYQGLLTQQLIVTMLQQHRRRQHAYCTLIKYFSHLSAVTDFPIFLISFKWSSTNSFGTAVLRERERKKKDVIKTGANKTSMLNAEKLW